MLYKGFNNLSELNFFATKFEKFFPTFVNVSLNFSDEFFVTFFEEVFETTLWFKEVFDWLFYFWSVAEFVFAVNYFEKWPVACFYCKFCDCHHIFSIVSPTTWTWSKNVEECCTWCVESFFSFFVQVFEVADKSCLSYVWDVVSSDNFCEVFTDLFFTWAAFTNCRCCCFYYRGSTRQCTPLYRSVGWRA
mgnify:CR=1 FL=1